MRERGEEGMREREERYERGRKGMREREEGKVMESHTHDAPISLTSSKFSTRWPNHRPRFFTAGGGYHMIAAC